MSSSSFEYSPESFDFSLTPLQINYGQGHQLMEDRLGVAAFLSRRPIVMSIDGGGIRGLIPALILDHIEKELKIRLQGTGVRIAECISLIAGTSTGGLIALGLNIPRVLGDSDLPCKLYPKYKAEEFVKLYTYEGRTIFKPRRTTDRANIWTSKYDIGPFTRVLSGYFGEKTLEDLFGNVFVTVCDVDREALLLLRNWEEPTRKYLCSDSALATGAAPTYFPIKKIDNKRFVDGGVGVNNPSFLAFLESKNLLYPANDLDPIFLVSIGTGEKRLHRKARKKSKKRKGQGLRKWVYIYKMMMKISSDQTDQMIKSIVGGEGLVTEGSNRDTYYRLQVPLDKTSLDDVKNKYIQCMIDEVEDALCDESELPIKVRVRTIIDALEFYSRGPLLTKRIKKISDYYEENSRYFDELEIDLTGTPVGINEENRRAVVDLLRDLHDYGNFRLILKESGFDNRKKFCYEEQINFELFWNEMSEELDDLTFLVDCLTYLDLSHNSLGRGDLSCLWLNLKGRAITHLILRDINLKNLESSLIPIEREDEAIEITEDKILFNSLLYLDLSYNALDLPSLIPLLARTPNLLGLNISRSIKGHINFPTNDANNLLQEIMLEPLSDFLLNLKLIGMKGILPRKIHKRYLRKKEDDLYKILVKKRKKRKKIRDAVLRDLPHSEKLKVPNSPYGNEGELLTDFLIEEIKCMIEFPLSELQEEQIFRIYY